MSVTHNQAPPFAGEVSERKSSPNLKHLILSELGGGTSGYGTTFCGGANNGRVQGTVRIVNPTVIDHRRDVATKGRIFVAGLTNVSATD